MRLVNSTLYDAFKSAASDIHLESEAAGLMIRYRIDGVLSSVGRVAGQALAQAFGGSVVRHEPVHGKQTTIDHDGKTLFSGLPSPLTVGRYHSLIAADADLPDCFEVSARGDGLVMAVRHRGLPAEGVQFHPESVLTEDGVRIVGNFLSGADR